MEATGKDTTETESRVTSPRCATIWGGNLDSLCLDSLCEDQNDDDQQQQTESAARVISPTRAIWPGGQNGQKKYHQDDSQKNPGHFFLLVRDSLIRQPSLAYEQVLRLKVTRECARGPIPHARRQLGRCGACGGHGDCVGARQDYCELSGIFDWRMARGFDAEQGLRVIRI
jgi:hypothetical protein